MRRSAQPQPSLFAPAAIPAAPHPADPPWCGYPARHPAADCLSWRRGRIRRPQDCADCLHRRTHEEPA